MVVKSGKLAKGFPTLPASVRLLTSVNSLVHNQLRAVTERFPTVLALVGLLPSVCPLMPDERRVVKKGLPAGTAFLVSVFLEDLPGWGWPSLQAFVLGRGLLTSLHGRAFLFCPLWYLSFKSGTQRTLPAEAGVQGSFWVFFFGGILSLWLGLPIWNKQKHAVCSLGQEREWQEETR